MASKARHRLTEFMQVHRFWLVNIVPSARPPFFVLGAPFLGFQSISSPEFAFETEEVKEMNSLFKHTIYTGGEVSPITLTRGMTGYDDSMWDWIRNAMLGRDVVERTLLLLAFAQPAMGSVDSDFDLGLLNPQLSMDAWEGAMRVPGKAWLLHECVPTRYKAGSDFDATSGEVSLMELEIKPRAFNEFTLLAPM